MVEPDHDYYSRRAAEERERAERSPDRTIALSHLKLAEEYERRLRDLVAAE